MMRQQFVKTIESIFEQDCRLVVLLGDIGVYGFRRAFEKYPERIYNIGILEQATMSLAAGLACEGLIPVIHTIAPFVVERSLEQIKIDFCYQQLGGNIVSVGGSYDYAALGCTHHCPADIGILKNLPGMQIVVPGHAQEFDRLFVHSYANSSPTYFRLSEKNNSQVNDVEFGKALVLKTGAKATVIAVGPVLDNVMSACADMDVTILYYTCLSPFDGQTLADKSPSAKILICEPYYSGAMDYDVIKSLGLNSVMIQHVGVPREFLTKYGIAGEHDVYVGLTPQNIRSNLENLINA